MTRETEKKPLLSLSRKDFVMQFFRAGGKGGQKQNKTSSACRISHPESGAVGESREQRSQMQNRKLAFQRLADSKRFKVWLRLKIAAVIDGFRSIEEKVQSMMRPENLRIEIIISYTCDKCGRKEQAIDEAMPTGWLYEAPDTHICLDCWHGGD